MRCLKIFRFVLLEICLGLPIFLGCFRLNFEMKKQKIVLRCWPRSWATSWAFIPWDRLTSIVTIYSVDSFLSGMVSRYCWTVLFTFQVHLLYLIINMSFTLLYLCVYKYQSTISQNVWHIYRLCSNFSFFWLYQSLVLCDGASYFEIQTVSANTLSICLAVCNFQRTGFTA